MTKFEQGSGGCPLAQGVYPAEYIGDEMYEPKPGDRRDLDWKPSIFLKWRVTAGEYAGTEVSRLMPANSTPRTYLGQFAASILGRQIQAGETYDLDEGIGVHGQLLIGPDPKKPEQMVPLSFTRDAVQPQPVTPQPATAHAQPMQPAEQEQTAADSQQQGSQMF